MDQPDLTETERLRELYTRRVAGRAPAGGHVAPEALAALIRREGTEEERLATLEHVMSCADCHREYQWLSEVDQAAAEADAGAGRSVPWWRRGPVALAASLIVAVGAALLLQSRLRSGAETTRGGTGEITLLAPGRVPPAGRPLTFVWRPLAGVESYVLEVQRQDGAVAFSTTTSDTTFSLEGSSVVLPDGQYRWWVREETDGSEPRSSPFRPMVLSGR